MLVVIELFTVLVVYLTPLFWNGELVVKNGQMVIKLHEPIIGVAPGQTAVLYLGTRVLGQTTIDETVSAVPTDDLALATGV